MRLLDITVKTFREQLRSGWDMVLSISLAPVFIVLYWLFMGGSSATAMNIIIIDHDSANCVTEPCAQAVIDRLRVLTNSEGEALFKIENGQSEIEAERKVQDGLAIAAIVFPLGYSAEIRRVTIDGGTMMAEGSAVIIGDPSQLKYPVATVYIVSELERYVAEATSRPSPFLMQERFITGAADVNDFNTYIPGLLITAITMVMFSVAITVARDIENGTAKRLIMSRMNSFDLMGGVSLVYIFLSLISAVMAFVVAIGLGYQYSGSLTIAILVSVIASVSVISVGLITAGFSKTVGRAAIIVNFPLLILLFFSGGIFPLPSPTLFTLGGKAIRLFDFLPTSHAVAALNQVLGNGATISEIGFEIAAMLLLTAVYATTAVWLYRRLQMR